MKPVTVLIVGAGDRGTVFSKYAIGHGARCPVILMGRMPMPRITDWHLFRVAI